MDNLRYIKDWQELKDEKSPTHILEIDVESGCGWVLPNEDNTDVEAPHYYLSTHTFYGSTFKASTKLLQSCGFNVKLANWDEIGY